jgi:hypothetical protein
VQILFKTLDFSSLHGVPWKVCQTILQYNINNNRRLKWKSLFPRFTCKLLNLLRSLQIIPLTWNQQLFSRNEGGTWISLSLSLSLSTALVDLSRFFSFLIYTQLVQLLRRGLSPSQGLYVNTEQHKHRTNAHKHPWVEYDSTHDPSVPKGEDSSCITPRGTVIGGGTWLGTFNVELHNVHRNSRAFPLFSVLCLCFFSAFFGGGTHLPWRRSFLFPSSIRLPNGLILSCDFSFPKTGSIQFRATELWFQPE